jgi:TatD DNase family protein
MFSFERSTRLSTCFGKFICCIMSSSAASSSAGTGTKRRLRLFDIGANLLDAQFQGRYHGRQIHAGDMEGLVSRAVAAGVCDVMVTGSDLATSRAALALAREWNAKNTGITFHSTVGMHPCSSKELTPGEMTVLGVAKRALSLR